MVAAISAAAPSALSIADDNLSKSLSEALTIANNPDMAS